MTNEEAIMILKAMIDDMILVFDRDRKEALNMAIEALKEQPERSQNTSSKQPDLETLGVKTGETCEDVISRQAAIDAILAVTGNSSVRELYEHVQEHGLSEMWSGGVNAAIDIIIAVPSAQPEPCEDAVSRQAAIDVIFADKIVGNALLIMKAIGESDKALTLNSACDRHIRAIEQLPSVQPERKTGEWISDGPSYIGGYDWMHCSECEHKEIDCPAGRTNYCPNCGAKMK